MFSQKLIDHLAPLMPSYPHVDIAPFESIFKKVKYKKKEFFIREYDESNKIALVDSGIMRIYLLNKKGEEKTHSFIAEGGFTLNHFWIYEKTPSPVNIQAIEDTVLFETTSEKVEELLRNHRPFEELYRNIMIQNWMFKLKREMFFVTYDASERLEHLDEFPFVDVNRIPKGHLATYLGIKPQSLSRLIKKDE
jgi:CRP-like cAMP-binding protein